MKHLKYFALGALAVFGMTACQDDKDPVISTATEFVLNTPPMADQTLVLSPEGTYTFSVSQPNYGLTLAPTYGIEVSLKQDFTPLEQGSYTNPLGEEVAIPGSVVIPVESQIHAVLTVKQSNLASAICALRGIGNADDYTEVDPMPLYVRANSMVGNQQSTYILSNVIELKAVKGYSDFTAAGPADVLYTPGNPNGWSFDACQQIPAVKDKENTYEGYLAVDGDFKFTKNPDWSNPGNYGAGSLAQAEDGSWSAELVENGGNFTGLEAGLYYVSVTLTNLATAADEVAGTVTLTPITSVGLIGDFNGWELEKIIEMSPMEGLLKWKAENVDLGDGGWKFTMNHAWTYNLGGADGSDNMLNLTQNGGNLKGAGSQTVILDLSKLPYSAKFE